MTKHVARIVALSLLLTVRQARADECNPDAAECVKVQTRGDWALVGGGGLLFALGYTPTLFSATKAGHEAAAIPVLGAFIEASKREDEQASDPHASKGKFWFAYGSLGVLQLVGLGVVFAGAIASETHWVRAPKAETSLRPTVTADFTRDGAHVGLTTTF